MTDSRPPYGSAALMALAVLVLYVVTLAPTTAFWDTSEYIATGYILGIPHPPGNPLFVMLARTWALLLAPTGLSPAVRINLFAAVTSAASAGLWFLVAHRLLLPVLRDDRRALELKLSAKGREAVLTFLDRTRRHEMESFGPLELAEREELMRLLTKYVGLKPGDAP